MSQPVVPPPIQPPRPQHQPPAPKPLNAGLVAAMVITAFAVTGLAIWAGVQKQGMPAERPVAKQATTEPREEPVAAPPPKTEAEKRREKLISVGLDPDIDYPYWPLVYRTDYKATAERSMRVIRGTIHNYGPQEFSYVAVLFGVYDEDGNKITSGIDTIAGLGAGETWSYEILVTDSRGDAFRLEEIRAR